MSTPGRLYTGKYVDKRKTNDHSNVQIIFSNYVVDKTLQSRKINFWKKEFPV